MNNIFVAIVVGIAIIGGAFFIAKPSSSKESSAPIQNVAVVDGKQIIDVTAKGGYQPRKSIAKANIPTVLQFNTSGTFDCSSAVRIPSINVSKNLGPTGITEIDLGNPKVGILQGTCGMGMYPFEIDFQV